MECVPVLQSTTEKSRRLSKWNRASKRTLFQLLLRSLIGASYLALSALASAQDRARSPLTLTTSDPHLQQSFDWAKQQALAYVSSGHDPVKDWYEAALPGRHAFCMRDVSHQAAGAAALGLVAQNKSMLTRFAKNISIARDWASYWEIDRDDKPSPADYVSDQDFWYNLPANFDVMLAALRMYMWTGDQDYIADPAFAAFYRHTMTDYVQRWQLDPAAVLSRPRIMNRHLATGKFVHSRGIPGYTEERTDFNLGVDLLASEYRAMRSYAALLRMEGKAGAATFDQKANAVGRLLQQHAWNQQDKHFYNALQPHGPGVGAGDALVLYFQAATDPQQRAQSLEELKRRTRQPAPGIEEQSYRPEILFHLDAPEEAYRQVMDMSRPDRERREYPEVSYAMIGAIVNGLMGINVVPKDSGISDRMLAKEVVLQTLPRLPRETPDATLDHLSVRGSVIRVRHTGNRLTELTNETGSAFTWRASFDGNFPQLTVNGKKMPTHIEVTALGTPVSSVDVDVPSGSTMTVSE